MKPKARLKSLKWNSLKMASLPSTSFHPTALRFGSSCSLSSALSLWAFPAIARRCPRPPSPVQAGRCAPYRSPTVGLGPREAWRGVGSTHGRPLPVPHAFPNAARQRSPARWARGCWNTGPFNPRMGSGGRPALPIPFPSGCFPKLLQDGEGQLQAPGCCRQHM